VQTPAVGTVASWSLTCLVDRVGAIAVLTVTRVPHPELQPARRSRDAAWIEPGRVRDSIRKQPSPPLAQDRSDHDDLAERQAVHLPGVTP
jgi:hypothetical protein